MNMDRFAEVPSPSEKPANAETYKNVIHGLVASSRTINRLMRQLGPELTPDTDASELADIARGASKLPAEHPLDTLLPHQRTPDIRAMSNVYSRLESEVTSGDLTTEALSKLSDYAHAYGDYRLAVLDAAIAESREGKSSPSTQAYERKHKILGRVLSNIQYEGNDDALREACMVLQNAFTDLIKGQASTRLLDEGKNLDPMLYDPTIQRLTEGDIRNASYQYGLIVDALLPKNPPQS